MPAEREVSGSNSLSLPEENQLFKLGTVLRAGVGMQRLFKTHMGPHKQRGIGRAIRRRREWARTGIGKVTAPRRKSGLRKRMASLSLLRMTRAASSQSGPICSLSDPKGSFRMSYPSTPGSPANAAAHQPRPLEKIATFLTPIDFAAKRTPSCDALHQNPILRFDCELSSSTGDAAVTP